MRLGISFNFLKESLKKNAIKSYYDTKFANFLRSNRLLARYKKASPKCSDVPESP